MTKTPESLDLNPPRSRGRRFWRFVRFMSSMSIGLLVTALALLVLWPYMIITVPSGHVGVLWKRLNGIDPYCLCFVGRGTVLDPRQLREEGLHIIAPWDRLYLYNLRLQSKTLEVEAISQDGVNVTAQINVRYQLVHRSVAVLHKFIGPNYMATIVAPEIGSLAREVISKYAAQEVYRSRQKIQDEIRQSAQRRLAGHLNMLVQPEAMEQPDPHHYNDYLQNSIQFLDTLVLDIRLPPAIVAAINRQTEQFYQIQEFKFRVEREAQESRRKQVEANGIAAFQKTVSQGISDSYLRWRGIEATLALAQSPNAKIVIIGSGKDGLPLILGNVDTPSTLDKGLAGERSGSSSLPSILRTPADQNQPGTRSNAPGANGAAGPEEGSAQPGLMKEGAPTVRGSKPLDKSSSVMTSPGAASSLSQTLSWSSVKDILSKVSGGWKSMGSTSSTRPQAEQ